MLKKVFVILFIGFCLILFGGYFAISSNQADRNVSFKHQLDCFNKQTLTYDYFCLDKSIQSDIKKNSRVTGGVVIMLVGLLISICGNEILRKLSQN